MDCVDSWKRLAPSAASGDGGMIAIERPAGALVMSLRKHGVLVNGISRIALGFVRQLTLGLDTCFSS